jgi:hypothetical protein
MIFKINKQVVTTTLCLVLTTLGTIAPASQAKPDFKTALKNFTDNLNIEMENYLKNNLHRNKVGFTVNNKSEDNSVKLSIPDYIERETFFTVNLNTDKNPENITISGKVLSKAESDLISSLAGRNFKDYKITNNLSYFPFKDIKNSYAVVSKPYSDLFVKPGDKSLATQVLEGTPLKILEISPDKKFARVQSNDDKYISWIPRQNIIEMDNIKWNSWINSRNSIIIKEISLPEKLYFGTILPAAGPLKNGKIKINLPAGKSIYINKTDTANLNTMKSNINDLVKTTGEYLKYGKMGKTTYLWGGTVGKDLDCSGFNQTVFRSEGIFLPRDADQQQNFAKPVATELKAINQLKPGDLLFFSENRQYATHTGIYIGKNQFIHSSSGGSYRGIKISTLQGGGEYDKKLQKMYFGGGRIDFKNMFGLKK